MTIEEILSTLPPVIEYYSREKSKQYANLKLEVYGADNVWYASYREPNYDGDIEHILVQGYGLKEALLNLRSALDEFPDKFAWFMWSTQSEIDRAQAKEQP